MTGGIRTRPLGWGFILLFALSLTALTCSQTSAGAAEPPFDDAEMGSKAGGGVTPRPEAARNTELLLRLIVEYKVATANDETRPVFEKYLGILGTQAILDVLEHLHPACHEQAHPLGEAVFAHFKDINRALAECQTRCTSGCMREVVGEAFGDKSLEDVTGRMARFSREGKMAEIHKLGNCAHGIGHALMIITDNDLEMALSACASSQDPAMGYYCGIGAMPRPSSLG